MFHKQHPDSKLALVGFRPGRKLKQLLLAKLLAKIQLNNSFCLYPLHFPQQSK